MLLWPPKAASQAMKYQAATLRYCEITVCVLSASYFITEAAFHARRKKVKHLSTFPDCTGSRTSKKEPKPTTTTQATTTQATTTQVTTTLATTTTTTTTIQATTAVQKANMSHVLVGVVIFAVLGLLLIAIAIYFIKKKQKVLGKVTSGSQGVRTMEGEEDSAKSDNSFVYANIAKPSGLVPTCSSLESPITNEEKPTDVVYSTVEFKAMNGRTSIQPPALAVEYASIVPKANQI
ncbi:uncharacterized protein [Heterodontus francisci]|uniref:uncharacterized protein n=1 Tax=Heterodontus francisci TaxID=7792 RepID=UPI00355BD1D4